MTSIHCNGGSSPADDSARPRGDDPRGRSGGSVEARSQEVFLRRRGALRGEPGSDGEQMRGSQRSIRERVRRNEGVVVGVVVVREGRRA